MLKDLVPEDVRQKAYLVFAIALVALGATNIFVGDGGAVAAVLADVNEAVLYVGAAFGFVAAGNTNRPEGFDLPVSE
jgi:hypothetical protein